ncbi:MAG: 2-C-methyl-D-erythritol 4-phosphate cytidylyltransferase [Oscillospiraceae bacterium]|jgi:2-C-methyl-D-erythritol 4-phosphate cytidylyltransferase|nr:2-C-methyl-D-erythritol 4-phosphate cytidylyltransferase [Oscillospiraceae bacterium]
MTVSEKLLGRLHVAAVIAAGGSSRRFGDDKLFAEILGVPVLARTIEAFERAPLIREIVVVAREESAGAVRELIARYGFKKCAAVVTGGDTRAESVRNGVLAVSKKARLIAIHDGARPCVTQEVIRKTIMLARRRYAAAPAVRAKSTFKMASAGVVTETLNRKTLYEIQTPQVFDADLIRGAYIKLPQNSSATDDLSVVELMGVTAYLSRGEYTNIKITTPEDIKTAEAFAREPERG